MDDRTTAWSTLLKVHAALVPVLDRELQDRSGLPITWYDVLIELNAAPDRRLTMTALGTVSVVSRSRVSRVVDELTRAGLVRREPNAADRRSALAVLTDEGRQRLRAAAPGYLDGIERHFTRHLSADEQRVIVGALQKVLDAAALPE
jgi:DNA-binding MarR family transcriptional regulator